MKLFTFLINHLKKWWVDESSPHYVRGFLQVIWHGLCLPIKFVYSVLDALGMPTHNPTSMTLSRRDKKTTRFYEQSASNRRIGLHFAQWLGWACIAWGVVAYAEPCVPYSKVDTTKMISTCGCGQSEYSHSFGNYKGIGVGRKGIISLCRAPTGYCKGFTFDRYKAGPKYFRVNTQPNIFKKEQEPAIFFTCYWDPKTGFAPNPVLNTTPWTTTTLVSIVTGATVVVVGLAFLFLL